MLTRLGLFLWGHESEDVTWLTSSIWSYYLTFRWILLPHWWCFKGDHMYMYKCSVCVWWQLALFAGVLCRICMWRSRCHSWKYSGKSCTNSALTQLSVFHCLSLWANHSPPMTSFVNVDLTPFIDTKRQPCFLGSTTNNLASPEPHCLFCRMWRCPDRKSVV